MSFFPFLLDDVLNDMRRPVNVFDQHYGLGMLPGDQLDPRAVGPIRVGYYRPWRSHPACHSGVSHIEHDKDGFKVNLDVQQFKPDELTVKTVNNFVVVEGKHEERQDEHGYISRQFQRRYKIPSDIEPDSIVSQLSSDGVLTISAPKKALPATGEERIVPITHTQNPALKPEIPKTDEIQKIEP